MHAAARCVELVRGCDALDERIGSFQASEPDVEGLEKLRRAVARERDVAVSLQTASDPLRGVTGLENNLRGFQLELECARWAPGVTAVRKRFANRTPSVDAKLEDDEVVEVAPPPAKKRPAPAAAPRPTFCGPPIIRLRLAMVCGMVKPLGNPLK